MRLLRTTSLLIAGLGLAALVAGCPGMPGAGGGSSAERMPPGMLPPPGAKTGGARTLMGTTITAPDDAYLLVKYSYGAQGPATDWRTCRRIIPLESAVMVEGINYDGRAKGEEKDVNQLLPFAGLTSFLWKYEPKPVPPAGEEEKKGSPQPRPGRRGR